MTHYRVIYYCDDKFNTEYHRTIYAKNGDPIGAAERAFETLPKLPADIVGVVVVPIYFH